MSTYGMQENANYKVIVSQSARGAQSPGLIVEGWIPETFQVAVSSQFSQPFGQSHPASLMTKLTTNVSLTSQSMTAQVWEGSQPIELTLEIEFIAESDPKREVLLPIVNLLMMTMPSNNGGTFLRPPGPEYTDLQDWKALVNDWQNLAGVNNMTNLERIKKGREGIKGVKGAISIDLGKFMYFDNVVIETVNTTFHSMMHSSGIPLRATCAVTFKTLFVPVAEDLANLFNLSGTENLGNKVTS
jgi:hypothetical protein